MVYKPQIEEAILAVTGDLSSIDTLSVTSDLSQVFNGVRYVKKNISLFYLVCRNLPSYLDLEIYKTAPKSQLKGEKFGATTQRKLRRHFNLVERPLFIKKIAENCSQSLQEIGFEEKDILTMLNTGEMPQEIISGKGKLKVQPKYPYDVDHVTDLLKGETSDELCFVPICFNSFKSWFTNLQWNGDSSKKPPDYIVNVIPRRINGKVPEVPDFPEIWAEYKKGDFKKNLDLLLKAEL